MEVSFNLQGKVALITGAAQGLGLAMAQSLAQAGADLIIADKNYEGAVAAAKTLGECGCRTLALEVDVTNGSEIQDMVRQGVQKMDGIDILINNAGINRRISALELSEQDWRQVIDTNLTGVFLCCQAVGRHMVERRQGRIINIASMNSMIVSRDRYLSAYCASKGAVVMLTKSLAVEWAPFGINVNAIAPGYFQTPLNEPWMADPQIAQNSLNLIPQGRFAQPRELGPTAVYLAAEASSYITGQVIVIDGGYTLW